MKLTAKRLEAELKRRKKFKKKQTEAFRLEKYLFDKQLEFVTDPFPFKIATTSRRSGKTIASAAHLINTAIENEGSTCIYITLSRKNAKNIIWKELLKINRVHKLGGIPNISELSIEFPNTSIIYVSGANTEDQIENFRGLGIKLCYIDEGQSFPAFIENLIDDVLGPALMENDGMLVLTGTPGPVPVGYFHKISTSLDDTWKRFYWTFYDNPHIALKSKKTHQEVLDRELKRRGVTINDPSVQREWFGRWVLDSDSLLIHYDATKNHYSEMKQQEYVFIMGIDLGFDDADAIAILAWSEESKSTILVEELITEKQGITELMEQIKYLNDKYKPAKLVIDQGGLGKKIAEELRKRYQLPLVAADKARKMENVKLLDDALRTGQFKAKSTSRFVQDSYLVEIDKDKSTPDRIVVSSRFHSDILDAVLYAFRESLAYTYTPAASKVKYGSREYYDKLQLELEEAAEEHFSSLEEEAKKDPYR